MKKLLSIALLGFLSVAVSCTKEDKTSTPTPTPTPTPTLTSSQSFENLVFTRKNAFFSTDGSMTAPIDSIAAKKIASKIDITFIYNYDYSEAGFFDPITRSKIWYWTYDYSIWCSDGIETKYYFTRLEKKDFDAAKTDQSKIAIFFSDTSVIEAPHAIYPVGSSIGGRESKGEDYLLRKGRVFGFKNVVSGKKGFIYVRTDQNSLWPMFEETTKVDIIKEK